MEYATDEGMDRDIRDILANLKFISKWADAKEKKLNLSKMQLVDNSWWNSLMRTLGRGSDSRDIAYKFMTTTVNRALDKAVKQFADTDPFKHKIGDMILDHLKEARPGVMCSSTPYPEDQMYQSRIETFLQLLDVKIVDIERKFGRNLGPLPPPPLLTGVVGQQVLPVGQPAGTGDGVGIVVLQ